MERHRKIRMVRMLVFSWLVLVSCKAPDFLSGLGKAIGNMFRGFGP